jgi:hypothetical protein
VTSALGASVAGATLVGGTPVKNGGRVVTGPALGALLAGAALAANGEKVATSALGASLAVASASWNNTSKEWWNRRDRRCAGSLASRYRTWGERRFRTF